MEMQGRPGTIKYGRVPLPAKEKEAIHARLCPEAGTPYNVTSYTCLFLNMYPLISYLEYFLHIVAKVWTNSAVLKLPCCLAPFIT